MPRIIHSSPIRAVLALLAGCLVALALAAALFRIDGGRWFVVSSPSMGRSAPVGTLVLTTPGAPRVGDIISFRPDGASRVYTHRVVSVAAGTIHTRGDINGADDPWTITRSQVIGIVVARLPGIGFLLRALPWLMLGWVVVWLASARLAAGRRRPVRVVGSALVFSGVALWLHPWVDMETVTYYPQGHGVTAQVVSTGVLPIRVTAVGGTSTDLVSGQVGVVHTDVLAAGRLVRIVPQLHMGPGWWLAVVAFCLLPLVGSLVAGLVPGAARTAGTSDDHVAPPSGDPTEGGDPPSRPRSEATLLITALAVVAGGALVAAWALHPVSTQAAFTASVTNADNTLGTGTWADCATVDTTTPGAWGVYPLGGTGKSVTDLTGQSPGSRSGTLGTTPPTGCGQAGSAFNGSTSCIVVPRRISGPDTFSLEAWFTTTTTANGKLIGFGNRTSASDTDYDRQIYIDPAGRVVFGVYPGSVRIIASPAGTDYADGRWHHVVATLSSAGMALYVDGTLAARDPSVTSAQSYSGYWKMGCGRLQGWESGNGNGYDGPNYYKGSLSYVAIYTTALTAAQVLQHYDAGRA